MVSIVVRGLEDAVKKRLVEQAHRNGRSMEAEVRDILTRVTTQPHVGLALLQVSQESGGVEDLPIPERHDIARAADIQ